MQRAAVPPAISMATAAAVSFLLAVAGDRQQRAIMASARC